MNPDRTKVTNHSREGDVYTYSGKSRIRPSAMRSAIRIALAVVVVVAVLVIVPYIVDIVVRLK